MAGVGACGMWPGLSLQGVGILYHGPKSRLCGLQGCGQHDTSCQSLLPEVLSFPEPPAKACGEPTPAVPPLFPEACPQGPSQSGTFLDLATMLLPSHFQACLQPVKPHVSGSHRRFLGAPSRWQGAGARVPKPLPHLVHP